MQEGQLKLLHKTLEDIRHEHEDGTEYWFARELYPILGYTKWENFETPIKKAKDSCRSSNISIDDHFPDVRKVIKTGKGAELEVSDIELTRYASYLVTLNGDPRKSEIAFAQAYFVTQTRKIEVLQEKMEEFQRLDARNRLTLTEKAFGAMAFNRGVDGFGIARIRNAGDQVLFGGKSTKQMKKKLGIKEYKPLADVLPKVTLIAKQLASAMTIQKAKQDNLHGEVPIKNVHKQTNANVRKALVDTDIYPENLPPAENVKKIQSRNKKEQKQLQKGQKKK